MSDGDTSKAEPTVTKALKLPAVSLYITVTPLDGKAGKSSRLAAWTLEPKTVTKITAKQANIKTSVSCETPFFKNKSPDEKSGPKL